MPYLGSTPNASFSSRTKQDFTANGSTTAFTLSSAVASANDIEVFVGNVRQEPTEAYTVNGTTLTMSEAPATGMNFYVVFKQLEENSVVPADGTISTAKLVNDSVTGAKIENNPAIAGNATVGGTLGVTGETTLTGGAKVNTIKHTGGTTSMTIDSSGRVLQPARPMFHANGTSTSWVIFSNGAWTKLLIDQTPTVNVGSHYDNTNSKFVAPVAGVYHFYYKVYGRVQSGGAASTYWQSRFQKNNSAISGYGAVIMAYQYTVGGTDEIATYSANISLAANDEITVHAQSAGSHNGEYYGIACEFGGHLLG